MSSLSLLPLGVMVLVLFLFYVSSWFLLRGVSGATPRVQQFSVTQVCQGFLWLICITTYNVLLRYLAFVGRCYSLLPIMLKIFDVICQLADDFYEKKKYIFPHFSGILPLQVRQSLFTITLNNLQVAVFRQRSNIFQQSR